MEKSDKYIDRTQKRSAKNNLIDKFKLEFERVDGILIKTTPEKIHDELCRIISLENIRKVFLEEGFEQEVDNAIKSLRVDLLTTQLCSKEQLAEIDASITACDFLIAETGTIALIHEKNRLKSSLLLPKIHIVIANENKIIPDFGELFAQIGKDFDSILLITGPSRTADIEKVIVKGVHGPQKLYLLLISTSTHD